MVGCVGGRMQRDFRHGLLARKSVRPSPLRVSRAIIIVLDGAGIGALPDAAQYGDASSNTLGHVAGRVPLEVPTLRALGLGRVVEIGGAPPTAPLAAFGRMAEASPGKELGEFFEINFPLRIDRGQRIGSIAGLRKERRMSFSPAPGLVGHYAMSFVALGQPLGENSTELPGECVHQRQGRCRWIVTLGRILFEVQQIEIPAAIFNGGRFVQRPPGH